MNREWKLIFDDFRESNKRMKEVLKMSYSVIIRDASIKRFELTVELAWKTLKAFLKDQGVVCHSPKNCIQEAFRFGLIADDPEWIKMMEARNISVHTYSEKFAEGLYSTLKEYTGLFKKLEDGLSKYYA